MPFFADVGAITLSDIEARLRPVNYPPGSVVVREREAGEAMHFIVSGEVQVHLSHGDKTLPSGNFLMSWPC